MEKVELKIGEVFEYEGIKLKVIETEDYSCFGCYFKSLRDKCWQQHCMRFDRKDKKNVIFQTVE